MTIPTTLEVDVAEQSTPKLSFTVTDDDGSAVAGTSLDACTMAVFDEDTGTVLTTGRDITGDIDVNGLGAVSLVVADTTMHGTERIEWHVALIEWTFSTTKEGKATIRFPVVNLVKVT